MKEPGTRSITHEISITKERFDIVKLNAVMDLLNLTTDSIGFDRADMYSLMLVIAEILSQKKKRFI